MRGNAYSYWLVGCWGFTTVPVTKTIRLSEWITPGYTAIPGMTSLKDGDLQHSIVHIHIIAYSYYREQTDRQLQQCKDEGSEEKTL